MSLRIQDRHVDGVHVIALSGDIDIESARELRAHFVEHVVDPASRVVVDLSGVGFMDSSGLGALVGGWQITRDAGQFHVAGANAAVARVLSITGMQDVFTPFPTVEDALAS